MLADTLHTDSAGLTSFQGRLDNSFAKASPITATLDDGTSLTAWYLLMPSRANVSCAPMHTGPSTAPAGWRLPGEVIVRCHDRQGAPASYSSVYTQGPYDPVTMAPMPGGPVFTAPGYRRPGEFAFFWVLGSYPPFYDPPRTATYNFFSSAPAGPNFIAATGTP